MNDAIKIDKATFLNGLRTMRSPRSFKYFGNLRILSGFANGDPLCYTDEGWPIFTLFFETQERDYYESCGIIRTLGNERHAFFTTASEATQAPNEEGGDV